MPLFMYMKLLIILKKNLKIHLIRMKWYSKSCLCFFPIFHAVFTVSKRDYLISLNFIGCNIVVVVDIENLNF